MDKTGEGVSLRVKNSPPFVSIQQSPEQIQNANSMLYKKALPNAKINLSSFMIQAKKTQKSANGSYSNMPTAISNEKRSTIVVGKNSENKISTYIKSQLKNTHMFAKSF